MRFAQFRTLAFGAALLWSSAPALAQDLPAASFKIIGPSLNSPPYELVKSFWEGVEAESGGKLDIEVQSLTELGLKGPEVYRMAKLGVAQVVIASLAFTSGDVPENDAMDFPGLNPNYDVLAKSIEAYLPHLQELYRTRSQVELLGVWPLAAQVFWCNKPVASLADLKGKKVRTSGASLAEFLEAAGAVPATLPFAEMIPGIQRGVIDCAVTGTVAGNLSKLYEVTTDIYPLSVGWGLEGNIVNKSWWDGLDPALRTFLAKKMDEMTAFGWDQARSGTDHGLWCSTGDPRCDVSVTKPLPLTPAHLKLATVSAEDDAMRRELLETKALAEFAARCGAECAAVWNDTLGKLHGLKASAH
ncbi:TRAP transporter substrate-binding protein [Propylenella binzhouense]|nr:TRAP transporter substrate-binding protein [Propylenella binzhouense]